MIALVFGGARSGKSDFAEQLALRVSNGQGLFYLACARATDQEMEQRIARHRENRVGKGFETLEQPAGVGALAGRFHRGDTVLLDDLTILLSNEMYGGGKPDGAAAGRVLTDVLAIAAAAGNLILVSNDLFGDAERYPADLELYRDGLARIHRELAARVDRVVELVCGIPLYHKGGAI